MGVFARQNNASTIKPRHRFYSTPLAHTYDVTTHELNNILDDVRAIIEQLCRSKEWGKNRYEGFARHPL